MSLVLIGFDLKRLKYSNIRKSPQNDSTLYSMQNKTCFNDHIIFAYIPSDHI